MFRKLLIVAAAATMGAIPATASTDAAWQAMDQRVNQACIAASGLMQARVVTDRASFSDRVPVELRIVEGYNSQSVIDVKLCAYNRRNKRAVVTEAVGRLGVYRN